MNKLTTILGTEIPINARGILYLCDYSYLPLKLTVFQELIFESAFDALTCYAEIPNPESQLVTGKTFDELIKNLHRLHNDIKDVKWLENLGSQL
jgi:hypothetical protein